MEQTHSMFIATDELFTSPLIQRYASLFDVSLTVQNPTLLSFVIPFNGLDAELKQTSIHFNTDLIDVTHASIYRNPTGQNATLSLTIEPRDVGVTGITISTKEQHTQSDSHRAIVPRFISNRPLV